jgi:hypothetical protein
MSSDIPVYRQRQTIIADFQNCEYYDLKVVKNYIKHLHRNHNSNFLRSTEYFERNFQVVYV